MVSCLHNSVVVFVCLCQKIQLVIFLFAKQLCSRPILYFTTFCIKMHNVIQYIVHTNMYTCIYLLFYFWIWFLASFGKKVLFLSFSVEKVIPNVVLTKQKTSKKASMAFAKRKSCLKLCNVGLKMTHRESEQTFYVMCNQISVPRLSRMKRWHKWNLLYKTSQKLILA